MEIVRNDLRTLLKALKSINRLKKHEKIEIKKAEALTLLYSFDKAIMIYEKLLTTRLERKYEIQIRKNLIELYDESDREEKNHINNKRLLSMGVKDNTLIHRFILDIIYNDYPINELGILKKQLRNSNAVDYWNWIFRSIRVYKDKLVEIYEYINPSIELLDANLIEAIVSQYYDNQSYKKTERLLSKCRDSGTWNANLSYYEAMLLLQKQEVIEAEMIIDEELHNNPNNTFIIICKRHILFNQEHFSDALVYYQKAFDLGEEIRTIRNLVLCELNLGKEDDARHRLLVWLNKPNNNSRNLMLYLWTLYQEYPEYFMMSILDSINPGKKRSDGFADYYDIALEHILKITDEEKEKGYIRYYLIVLLSSFEYIKNHLKYSAKEELYRRYPILV